MLAVLFIFLIKGSQCSGTCAALFVRLLIYYHLPKIPLRKEGNKYRDGTISSVLRD